MTVFEVVERFDNCEPYENYFSYSETVKIFAKKEKAINYIKELSSFEVFEEDYEREEAKDISNKTFVYARRSDEEIIRTVKVKIYGQYMNENGDMREVFKYEHKYQYAIRETEVIE